MLNLIIILILAVVLTPVFLCALPFMLQPDSWPELPSEEEHYISPPRVIFAQPVHTMFTQDGMTENVCLCHQCYTVMMLTLELEKEHAKKRRTPPPIPAQRKYINHNNPLGFDLSDIEVNSSCSPATLEFSSALSATPGVARRQASTKLQAATEQQHGTSHSRWDGHSRPAPS